VKKLPDAPGNGENFALAGGNLTRPPSLTPRPAITETSGMAPGTPMLFGRLHIDLGRASSAISGVS
jgi:hypothetical protein